MQIEFFKKKQPLFRFINSIDRTSFLQFGFALEIMQMTLLPTNGSFFFQTTSYFEMYDITAFLSSPYLVVLTMFMRFDD